MSLLGIFTTVGGWFKKLFSKDAAQAVQSVIVGIAPLVNAAMPVVRRIAELTPTKTDDMVLAAYEQYGLSHLFERGVDLRVAVRDLAVRVLEQQMRLSHMQFQSSSFNLAVELAYQAVKLTPPPKE